MGAERSFIAFLVTVALITAVNVACYAYTLIGVAHHLTR